MKRCCSWVGRKACRPPPPDLQKPHQGSSARLSVRMLFTASIYMCIKGTVPSFNIRAKLLANASLMTALTCRFSPKDACGACNHSIIFCSLVIIFDHCLLIFYPISIIFGSLVIMFGSLVLETNVINMTDDPKIMTSDPNIITSDSNI